MHPYEEMIATKRILSAIDKGQIIVVFPYVVSFIFITLTGVSKFYVVDS